MSMRARSAVRGLTAAAQAFLSTACMTWATKDIRTVADWPRQNQKVLSVVTASGGLVQFDKSSPGRMQGSAIYGLATTFAKEPIELEGPFPSVRKRADGSVFEVTDRNGKVYGVKEVLKTEEDRMIVLERSTGPAVVSVPIADARLIKVRKTNGPLTFLAIMGVLGGVYFGGVAISLAAM
jgi:hypothetical protein